MKRTKLNFLIDVLSYSFFLFLITTGILMRYILPPGTGRFVTIWGMSRHDWGTIHFWISVTFLAFMVLHVYLHWKWIVCMTTGKPGKRSGIKTGIIMLGIALIAMAPVLSPREYASENEREHPPYTRYDEITIHGSMTLSELEQETGVPAGEVLKALDLPGNIPAHWRLGNIARRYGLDMSDFRKAVYHYLNEGN